MESKSKISPMCLLSTDINELGYFDIKIFFNKNTSHHVIIEFLCLVIFVVIKKVNQQFRMIKR